MPVLYLFFAIVFPLSSRNSPPLVTITIDSPTNSSEIIHVTSGNSTLNTTTVDLAPTGLAEQLIRIELVQNSDTWWSGSEQLHFPHELSVQLLLGLLGFTFLSALAVSVLLIAKWWNALAEDKLLP